MRIAELSRRTGVAVPTIKYYLREGLLPAGERTSPNQAQYDDVHERRLRLVRALIDVGGLSISATRAVLEHLDAPDISLFKALGAAQYAVTTPRGDTDDDFSAHAQHDVADLITRRGWQVHENSPAWRALSQVLATLRRLGQQDALALLDTYAEAAERIAEAEVTSVLTRGDRESIAEAVVLWTVLGDVVISMLRRLAQEDASARRLDH